MYIIQNVNVLFVERKLLVNKCPEYEYYIQLATY